MKPRRHPRLALAAAWASCLALPLFAADKIDLNRTTPVPDNEPIPVQDFFRLPLFTTPQLNPAGTHLAALMSGNQDRLLPMVSDIEKQSSEIMGGQSEYSAANVYWLNDTRLAARLVFRKTYGISLIAANVGSLANPYPLIQFAARKEFLRRTKDPEHPLLWVGSNLDSSPIDVGVTELDTNVTTGQFVNLLSAGAGDVAGEVREWNWKHIRSTLPKITAPLVSDYFSDKHGELAFGTTSEEGRFTLHRFAAGKWSATAVDLDAVDLLDAGNQPGEVAVRGPRQADKPRALELLDTATNQSGQVLLQDKVYDFFGSLYRDPASRDIVGATFWRVGPQSVWFSEEYRALQKLIDGNFPGLVARIESGSIDGGRFIVSTQSDRQPPIYYRLDVKTRSVGLVKNSAPWIDPKRMRPVNVLKYKTREGHAIDAYLTLPAGATKASPPPLVVLCPPDEFIGIGRNPARHVWGYNAEAQFLASRGYAVLQPNHRGSAGYGWMFPAGDRFAFDKMAQDLVEAARTVAKAGLVDANRIGIMGHSVGGFLAAAAAVEDPALFRAVVATGACYDWEEWLQERKIEAYTDPEYSYLVRNLGDPRKNAERYAALAPARHTDRIRATFFIAHGKDDTLVPPGLARHMASELSRNKVPVETLFLDDENHWINRLDSQVELFTHIESFLDRNLKGGH